MLLCRSHKTILHISRAEKGKRTYQRRLLRPTAAFDQSTRHLLDSFWQARGISDPDQRQELIVLADASTEEESRIATERATALKEGIFWRLGGAQASNEVRQISARLLALRRLLGNSNDIDIIWMLERAPRLLTADMAPMAQQLLTLRMKMAANERDIIKIVEKQPALLLQKPQSQQEEESDADRDAALKFGLMSDAEAEWQRRCRQLARYHQDHGDPHVGFRDADDRKYPDLGRWANKQRAALKAHNLPGNRELALRELDFEFEEEEAHWLRWYGELRRLYEAQGPGFAINMSSSQDLFLSHWCSVQRVARRAGVISSRHYMLLEDIAFDWSGADALS